MENSWPFQWYQLIPCRGENVILLLSGSKEMLPENDGKCSTSGVSQNKRHFPQSAQRVATQTSWPRSYERKLRWQSLPANLHQQRSSAAFSLTAAGSRCGSAAPKPSAYLWWLQAAEMKGNRQSREKAEKTSEAQPKRSLAKRLHLFFLLHQAVSAINQRSERTQHLCSAAEG